MLNIKFTPLHFTLFLSLGILFGFYFEVSIALLFIVVTILLLGLAYFYNKAKQSFEPSVFFPLFTTLIFLTIGMINVQLHFPNNQKNHYSNHYSANNQIIMKIRSVLKPTKTYQKYEAEIIQVDSVKTSGIILLNIKKIQSKNTIKVDDLIFTMNPFQDINKALNPNEFNYRNFLKKKGIYNHIFLKKGKYLFMGMDKHTLKGYAFHLRSKINKSLKKYHFSENELAIINAIILGQRQYLSKDLFNNYKNAGAIHILAVSGLHIGIILLLLNFLFQPVEYFKNGKAVKLVLIIISLWIYAFIAGMSASVIRAVTMFTAIAIGWLSNRPSSIKYSLILSFFFLLLIHPFYLFDVGFQLSYVAVFSIVLIQPLLAKLWKPKIKSVYYFWQLVTVSFAAQIGILPLSLYYFHQFPGLFFVSSLVIIPFLGIIIGLGLLVITLSLFQILPSFLADIFAFILEKMNFFVDMIAQQKVFIFKDIYFSFLFMTGFYLLLITVIHFVLKKSIKRFRYVLFAVIFLQISFIYEKGKSYSTNEFMVFHQVKNSLVGIKNQNKIMIYHHLDTIDLKNNRVIKTYLLNQFTHPKIKDRPLQNIYKFNHKLVFVVDSLGVYSETDFIPNTVILTQSPKINLNRLIQVLHPKLIIADGSNYKSYTIRWENTCKKKQVNFYNTAKKGAFVKTLSP